MNLYEKAYDSYISNIWESVNKGKFTPYISSKCGYLALDTFSRDSYHSKDLREQLQFQFMKGLFSTGDKQDLLNRARHLIVTDNKMIKRLLDNQCNVYSEPVVRDLDDKQLQFLELIQYDDFLEKVHKLAKFNGKCLVFIGYDSKIRLQTLTPAWYNWIDGELWIADIMQTEQKKIVQSADDINAGYKYKYHVWTAEEYRLVIDNKVIETQKNKYGLIPFVEIEFADLNKYDYYDTTAGMYELLEKQLMLNTMLFSAFASNCYSNVSILWLNNIGLKDETTFGLGKVITTKTDSSVDDDKSIEFIQAHGNFNETDNFRNNLTKDVLKSYGIPSGVVEGGGVASGEALKIDRIELEEIRAKDVKVMEYYEKEISKIIDVVSQKHGNPYNLGDYMISYNELSYYTDPQKSYELNKEKFNNDLISIYDFMRNLGTIGTDTEIESLLQFNKKVNDEFRNAEQRGFVVEEIEGEPRVQGDVTSNQSEIRLNIERGEA